MKTNVGGFDRVARIAVGVGLIGATMLDQIGVWGWVGAIPLITGIAGTCPAYTLFGLSSCPMKKH